MKKWHVLVLCFILALALVMVFAEGELESCESGDSGAFNGVVFEIDSFSETNLAEFTARALSVVDFLSQNYPNPFNCNYDEYSIVAEQKVCTYIVNPKDEYPEALVASSMNEAIIRKLKNATTSHGLILIS